MNSIVNVSFNVSFVFQADSIGEVFNLLKDIYESNNDNSLENFNSYDEYVKYHTDRMMVEAKESKRVQPAPFTLVDVDSKSKISLLHYGDYSNSINFNDIQFSKYQTDSLLEIVACLNPELTDEDLSKLDIEKVKQLIEGNIILLTDNDLIPCEIFNKIYDNCVNHFNAFKQTVRL